MLSISRRSRKAKCWPSSIWPRALEALEFEHVHHEVFGQYPAGRVEAAGRKIVRLRADPGLLASKQLAERERLIKHALRNAAALKFGRHRDLVDIQLDRT